MVALFGVGVVLIVVGVVLVQRGSRPHRIAYRRYQEASEAAIDGRGEAALVAAGRAYELLTAPPLVTRPDTRPLREAVTLILAVQLVRYGYAREALQRLDEIEVPGHAERHRDGQICLLLLRASALTTVGAFTQAAGYSEAAVRIVREDPVLREALAGEHRDTVAAVLHCHALNRYHLGTVDEAVALLDEAAGKLREDPDASGVLCRNRAGRATFEVTTGRAASAEPFAAEAVKLGRDAEPSDVNRLHLLLALYASAGCLVQLGRAEEAVPLAAESVVLARSYGTTHPFHRLLLAVCLTVSAHALHRAGRTREAAELIAEAEPWHREAAAREPAANDEELAFALQVKAEVAASQGWLGDARQCCDEAETLYRRCAAGRPERFRYALSEVDELRRSLD
jgi:tetratricopeptide (TPR) repeat protein